jgi:hypothetical protein
MDKEVELLMLNRVKLQVCAVELAEALVGKQ